jgi:D-xylose transport system permease protein
MAEKNRAPAVGVVTEAGAAAPRQTAQSLRKRLTGGDLGSLPIIVGLLIIWGILQAINPNFLTARNLNNLLVQITEIGLLGIGVVMVLLLGEIDLSIGSVSGACAAVMGVTLYYYHWSAGAAIIAGILSGVAIGLFQGAWIAYIGVPSFIVTLAGLLGFSGLLLHLLGTQGTVNITDPTVDALTGTFLPITVGWILAIVGVVAYGAVVFARRLGRQRAHLPVPSLARDIVLFVVVGVVTLVVAGLLNSYLGLPLATVILLAFVIVFAYITKSTRFGRHVFAVGGNAEAARRAGINVKAIRVAVFAISGTMAAIGGIMGASRAISVSPSSGGGNLLLDAIATAVIGGTSLFGGRGTIWAALLGALVIGSIENGMDLLSAGSDVKYIVEGVVLLLAITIDAVSRRTSANAGR